MPTPKRRGAGGADGGCGSMEGLGGGVAARWVRAVAARSSGAVRHEEACDQRSVPQDVTSSWPDAEGSICSKRSRLSRPKDLLATPPKGYSRLEARSESEHTSRPATRIAACFAPRPLPPHPTTPPLRSPRSQH